MVEAAFVVSKDVVNHLKELSADKQMDYILGKGYDTDFEEQLIDMEDFYHVRKVMCRKLMFLWHHFIFEKNDEKILKCKSGENLLCISTHDVEVLYQTLTCSSNGVSCLFPSFFLRDKNQVIGCLEANNRMVELVSCAKERQLEMLFIDSYDENERKRSKQSED